MAGIGFALKKLSSQDNLASRSLAGGHAILISSGPWIVIMGGLALLHVLGQPILDPADLKVFSILVIYSFALSLVVTSPVSLEATLRVSRILFQRRFQDVQGVYLAALLITTTLSFVGGLVVFLGLIHLPLGLGIAATICAVQVSHLWLAMAFVAAIKQYGAVTAAFALGLSCSIVFGTSAAALGHGPGGMILGFSVGLCIAFCILNFLILKTFPGQLPPLRDLLSRLGEIRPTSKVFVAAGVCSALAVWIDKIIVWQSACCLPLATTARCSWLTCPSCPSCRSWLCGLKPPSLTITGTIATSCTPVGRSARSMSSVPASPGTRLIRCSWPSSSS
jgi:uncharacterized membrane protein